MVNAQGFVLDRNPFLIRLEPNRGGGSPEHLQQSRVSRILPRIVTMVGELLRESSETSQVAGSTPPSHFLDSDVIPSMS